MLFFIFYFEYFFGWVMKNNKIFYGGSMLELEEGIGIEVMDVELLVKDCIVCLEVKE